MSDDILETRNLSKNFGGFDAVRGVNLRVKRHTIHALIGPNGAGKTTCFNLLTKFLTPTSGEIFYNGNDITHQRPSALPGLGIVRSFQISAVFPNLTAIENVSLALQRRRGESFDFWRSSSLLDEYRTRAQALLDTVGLGELAGTLAANLSYGRKRSLEIATTLALEPELMLLDEPTAGMGNEDIQRISEVIQASAVGRTVLMVEHNLGVVSNLCETITVLARGEVIAEGSYESVSRHPHVAEAYMGTDDE